MSFLITIMKIKKDLLKELYNSIKNSDIYKHLFNSNNKEFYSLLPKKSYLIGFDNNGNIIYIYIRTISMNRALRITSEYFEYDYKRHPEVVYKRELPSSGITEDVVIVDF